MTEKEIRKDERDKCIVIVKSFIYGPAGQYDYSYSDSQAAADNRAEDILDELEAMQ